MYSSLGSYLKLNFVEPVRALDISGDNRPVIA